MISRATGLFSVYRGTTTNTSGDTVDDNTNPLYVSVPLGLRNGARANDNPNTATPRTISSLSGRAQRDLDLQANDRLRNQATDVWYVVDWVGEPASSTGNSDLQFVSHRVS